MLRIIRELQPRWVVGENVLGLVNWDGGLVFEEVQSDLESQGYEVQPYVLPACAVNAPHRRDRVWFVAYSKLRSAGQDRNSDKAQRGRHTAIHPQGQSGDGKAILDSGLCGLQGATPDADSNGQHRGNGKYEKHPSQRGFDAQRNFEPGNDNGLTSNADLPGRKERGQVGRWKNTAENTARLDNRVERLGNDRGASNAGQYGNTVSDWGNFPQTQPTIRSGDDGFSSRLDGITFPKWRNESIKAAGNAIVPQVAYQIFRAIELYEIQNGAK